MTAQDGRPQSGRPSRKIPEGPLRGPAENERNLWMAEYVKVEQDGRVATVTLDHPPVNALSSKLLEELEDEYDRLDRDDETRAIVLRGEGEKAFVAGADITEFPAMREQIEEAAESGSARGIQKLAARMDGGGRRTSRRSTAAASAAASSWRWPATSGSRRGRAARPARDQARPDPGRRRHAASAPAGGPGPRTPAEPHGRPDLALERIRLGADRAGIAAGGADGDRLGLPRTLSVALARLAGCVI